MKELIERFRIEMGVEQLEDIASLFQDYLDESHNLVQQIDEMIQQYLMVPPMDLEKIVHNLKGLSANMFVEPVYQKTEKLDDYLKTLKDSFNAPGALNLLWQPVLTAYQDTRLQIYQYFSDHGYSLN